jgi:hypothetical protein
MNQRPVGEDEFGPAAGCADAVRRQGNAALDVGDARVRARTMGVVIQGIAASA